ncbi:dynamin family protein [Rhodanobacter lindaniclasticus]
MWLKRHFELPTALDDLALALLRGEHEGGGYGIPPNLLDTEAAIAVLMLCGHAPPPRTGDFVNRMAVAGFGFRLTAGSLSPNLETVCAGIRSCCRLGMPIPHARDAMAYVLSCQTGNGGFARASGALPDITLTHLALTTWLARLGAAVDEEHDPRRLRRVGRTMNTTAESSQAMLAKVMADAADLPSVSAPALTALRARFSAHAFNLVVAGEFKRGKSTLVNALVGADLLPTGVVPLTSVVTLLRYGDVAAASVIFESGESFRHPSGIPGRLRHRARQPRQREACSRSCRGFPGNLAQERHSAGGYPGRRFGAQ